LNLFVEKLIAMVSADDDVWSEDSDWDNPKGEDPSECIHDMEVPMIDDKGFRFVKPEVMKYRLI